MSELRRAKPHGGVLSWIRDMADSDLHLSAVTIAEVQAGIEITRETDPQKAQEISDWLELVAATYNILPMDARTCREWAKLMHRRSDDLVEDGMIAATALVHNLTVVTRNVRDYKQFGVATVDQFATGRR